MIHDLLDHDRANSWAGIGRAQRGAGLSHKMLIAHAVEVASEGHTGRSGAETETVAVAREIGVAVGREQINLLAEGTESEVGAVGARRRIKVRFAEYDIAVAGDHGAVG